MADLDAVMAAARARTVADRRRMEGDARAVEMIERLEASL